MNDMEHNISNYLTKQGVSCSLEGYHYLVTAISFALSDPTATLIKITEHTARVHETSPAKVKSAMRYALQNGKHVFGSHKTKEFICTAAISLKKLQSRTAGATNSVTSSINK